MCANRTKREIWDFLALAVVQAAKLSRRGRIGVFFCWMRRLLEVIFGSVDERVLGRTAEFDFRCLVSWLLQAFTMSLLISTRR